MFGEYKHTLLKVSDLLIVPISSIVDIRLKDGYVDSEGEPCDADVAGAIQQQYAIVTYRHQIYGTDDEVYEVLEEAMMNYSDYVSLLHQL